MKNKNQGFALLIAVIFMSVMLSLGLALSSIGYKQQILASSAIESQYAFYVADAAMECALYYDQQKNIFDYASHDATHPPSSITCGGVQSQRLDYSYTIAGNATLYDVERLSLDAPAPGQPGKHCADVTVYKYASPQSPDNRTTYVFSQGYDVSCATVDSPNGARFVSRGINIHY